MDRQEIAKIETRIKGLSENMSRLGDPTDLNELMMLIRRPGFTTPAEAFLLGGMLDSMDGMARNLAGLKQAVMDGSRKVGAA